MTIIGDLPGHYDLLEASTLGLVVLLGLSVILFVPSMAKMGMDALKHRFERHTK